MPGSGVYVQSYRLKHLHLKSKNARDMTRMLLIELIGIDKLSKMSATGKNGLPKIPENILGPVECKYLLTLRTTI